MTKLLESSGRSLDNFPAQEKITAVEQKQENKMSNRLVIQQEENIVRHTAEMSKTVNIFDDYDQGSLSIGEGGFFDDEMELLRWVIKQIQEENGGIENIENMIYYIFTHHKGVEIEGVWYDWVDLESVFTEMRYKEDGMRACDKCGREISYLKHQEGQGLCGICTK